MKGKRDIPPLFSFAKQLMRNGSEIMTEQQLHRIWRHFCSSNLKTSSTNTRRFCGREWIDTVEERHGNEKPCSGYWLSHAFLFWVRHLAV